MLLLVRNLDLVQTVYVQYCNFGVLGAVSGFALRQNLKLVCGIFRVYTG